MDEAHSKPHWSLPYESPLPEDPRRARKVRAARAAAYVLLGVAMLTPVLQFQVLTQRREKEASSDTKGAIARWRTAVRLFWQGENIYAPYPAPRQEAEGLAGGTLPPAPTVWLHPNMPFVVMLLTPFAYMPMAAAAATYNILKLLVLAATLLMSVRVVNHGRLRMPDYILGVTLLWTLLLIIGDIQHGNTNVFVLGLIVLHLWLFRHGRDYSSGAALSLAIALKMTPALFLPYWLYQRNWRLLAGSAAGLVLILVVVPLAALGPAQWSAQTGQWYNNLIAPGLVKAEWYPIHVNQSISGVFSRYFLGGQQGGDINWGPDDNPYWLHELKSRQDAAAGVVPGKAEPGPAWIAFASLSPGTVKNLVRLAQLAVVLLCMWAIGWRKLPRDDGRRGLHYGLVVTAMLLLNQRTWDHHAGILLVAHLSAWYAIAFSRISSAIRKAAICLMLLAGMLIWLDSQAVVTPIARLAGLSRQGASDANDLVAAYGTVFYHFVLMLVTLVLLAVSLRNHADPYSPRRMKLSE